MTTDARLKAFLTDGGEVFSGVQQGQNLWKQDPFDVESINAPARHAFHRLLKRAVSTPPPDTGKLLLLRGESGSGKTHLVRAFRNLVHGRGMGYVGYMPMTVDTPHYERYILSNLIDSLDRPYAAPEGETGLMRLSAAVLGQCTSAFAPLIPDLEEEELNGMVSSVVNELQQHDPRFLTVHADVLRALLSLQHRNHDVRLHHAVLQWLRCKDLSMVDRQVLVDLSPRTETEDPKWMLTQLGRLMALLNQAFVLCVDQVEDISDFRQRPDLESPFRQAMNILTHLAGELPSAIVVICCLSDFWYQERQKVMRSMLDRIEHDPEPVDLDRAVTAQTARDIAALRLKYLYEQHGVPFDAADPTHPIPASGFEALSGRRTRDVLGACRRYRERAIQSQALPEHFPLPELAPGTSDKQAQTPSLPFKLEDMNPLWAHFRSEFLAPALELEEEISELLAWAMEAGGLGRDGETRFFLHKREETLLEVGLRPEGTRLLLAICNKSSRGGHLGRQMAEALQHAGGKKPVPVLVRTTDFPSTPGTSVAEQLIVLKKKGGRTAVLADGDLRDLMALRLFWRAHAEPVLREWNRTEKPFEHLQLLQGLLGLSDLPQLAPAAQPAPSEARRESRPPTEDPPPRSLPKVEETPIKVIQPPDSEASTVTPLARSGSEEPAQPKTQASSGASRAATKASASRPTGALRVGTQEGLFSDPITLEPDELTRHSAFLGGSGSGKTTVALNVLEQLLLRGIPTLLVDRKGDLAGYAKPEAWEAPLHDEALVERRRLLRERVDVALYTPGRSDGRPLVIPVVPQGLNALPPEEREQGVQQATDAIAGMLEYKSSSRDRAAKALLGQAINLLVQRPLEQELTLELVRQFIQSGDPALVQEAEGLDPKTFQKLSQDLAMLRSSARSLLSTQGERLDLDELLGRGPAAVPGRTRLSIISTKFLGTTPSVLFWVSQLLREANRWASQHPAPHLQAALLFDEADMYLPAMSQPATKQPMENLLKRARSAGVGVMLATQSPGDLDYKCRENVRSWFVGRVREDTALRKLKPMFAEAPGGDATTRLAGQKQGQFHLQRDGRVQQLKADRNVLLTEQLSEEEILRLARASLGDAAPLSTVH